MQPIRRRAAIARGKGGAGAPEVTEIVNQLYVDLHAAGCRDYKSRSGLLAYSYRAMRNRVLSFSSRREPSMPPDFDVAVQAQTTRGELSELCDRWAEESPRRAAVLREKLDGRTNRQVAESLGLTLYRVESDLNAIRRSMEERAETW
ncbi:MAG: sigma-70 family RNA polymerase sigma factor [bacterium]|nr:sigma-70 family RNA polymerase sigma factor [bacterium]